MLRFIGVYKTLDMHCRPSEVMEIADAYTAFCFDEAIAYIIQQLKDGKEPCVQVQVTPKHYSKPSDFYKQYE